MRKVYSLISSLFLIQLCLLTIISLFLMEGCSNEIHHWEFAYDYDSVSEIKIVEVSEETEYSLIKEIDVAFAEQLYTDIKSLEMKRYGIELMSPAGVCILIVFDNGAYDIISKIEPKHYRYFGDEKGGTNSWLRCDEDQFDALIDKYLNQ